MEYVKSGGVHCKLFCVDGASGVQELEDKILRLLKEAKGNILDDEVLINTLNNSKLTAGMIQNRVREAEETEDNINQVFANHCCGTYH